MKLQDGEGSGRLVGIDGTHRLKTNAVTHPVIHFQTHVKAKGALVSSNFLNTGAVSTELSVFYLKCTSLTESFNPEDLIITHDGGTAANTEHLEVNFYVNATAPSANNTALTPVNGRLNSSSTPAMTAEAWDETVGGMTVTTNGSLIMSLSTAPGVTSLMLSGVPVISPDKAIMVTVSSPSSTDIRFSINMDGYFI